MLSKLDMALSQAIEEPEKYEGAYYELFLNSQLFIPTWDTPKEEQSGELDADQNIVPVILEDDDLTIIPIFDSEERLVKWADGQEFGLAALSGYDVLDILGAEYHLILNVTFDYAKEFSKEEIEYILSMTVTE